MKAIALANRLARDLNEKSMIDLAADARLELLDAINGGLQNMHAVSPHHTKITTGSLYAEEAATVSIGVTRGSAEITGAVFTADQYGRTVQVAGDPIDNQVASSNSLLHPYMGSSGTVSAIIYSDAIPLPEPYMELVGDPIILETQRTLTHRKIQFVAGQPRTVCEPRFYWVEANAGNRASSAKAFIRFNSLPDRAYRLSAEMMMAPERVTFADLLSPGSELSIRQEHVEIYLLPIARGLMTSSELWKNSETKAEALKAGYDAEEKYSILASTTLATPNNEVGTPQGF